MSVLPITAFFFSILNLFAFGLSSTLILVSILSLFCAIWNTRALIRFLGKLVIDHYSILFIFISVINLALTIALCVIVVMYSPVYNNLKKFNVEKNTFYLSGNFTDGFTDTTDAFNRKTVTVTKFVSKDSDMLSQNTKGTVILLPSKNASNETYAHFMTKLAFDGYTVYSAEFYNKDNQFFNNFRDSVAFRRFSFNNLKISHNSQYESFVKSNASSYKKEAESLINYIKTRTDAPYPMYFVYDYDASYGIKQVEKIEDYKNITFFDLASIKDYTTKGLGPIEQSDPFFAFYFGYEKDKSLYMSSHLANEFEKICR